MIDRIYDLKGSKYKREIIFKTERSERSKSIIRKDLNFNKEIGKINLENREGFIKNIINDAEFFEDLNLMDYSLLFIKLKFNEEYDIESLENFKNAKDYCYYKKYLYFPNDKDHSEAYLVMIIDYLQVFTYMKYLENNIKNFITERPTNSDDISCVAPDVYCKRFINYMKSITNPLTRGLSSNSDFSSENKVIIKDNNDKIEVSEVSELVDNNNSKAKETNSINNSKNKESDIQIKATT